MGRSPSPASSLNETWRPSSGERSSLKQVPGHLHVLLEEGEWSAWLHEVLEPHVAELVVEKPQWKQGSKSDAIDAYGLAERLRSGQVKTEVCKAPRRFTKLRELARTYEVLTNDVVRVKNRLRSAYRRRALCYPGHDLVAQAKGLPELPVWMHQSIEASGIELASIEELRSEIEEAMVAESRRFPISRVLRTAPGLGPIRVAQMMPIVITPHRFRTKRQFWAYCGFGVVVPALDARPGRRPNEKTMPPRRTERRDGQQGPDGSLVPLQRQEPAPLQYRRRPSASDPEHQESVALRPSDTAPGRLMPRSVERSVEVYP